jgi:hypothetical protein
VCGAKATLIIKGEPTITYGADFRAKCKDVGSASAADATGCEAMLLAVKRTLARHKRAAR